LDSERGGRRPRRPDGPNGWDYLDSMVSTVFTPAAPISEDELFAGRIREVQKVIDAINQVGQHVVIYGERGVGKTSLANILSSRLVSKAGAKALSPRVNCDGVDSFDTLWRKVFSEIGVTKPPSAGFVPSGLATGTTATYAQSLPQAPLTPDAVRRHLAAIGRGRLLLVILEEFDRLPNGTLRGAIADTIKSLSDHAVHATLVLVGVAEAVSDLIAEHQSIERALAQVLMPRMEKPELQQILDTGIGRLKMTMTQPAKHEIVSLSQGLPHYAHLLGLYSARAALEGRRREIKKADVRIAIDSAVMNTHQSLVDAYRTAVSSPQSANLYGRVLLACARARVDEFGFFAASDVREPMSSIMGKRYDIPSYAKHLKHFCDPSRGRVLRIEGGKRKYRYRFRNPLMPSFVVMRGIIDGLVDFG